MPWSACSSSEDEAPQPDGWGSVGTSDSGEAVEAAAGEEIEAPAGEAVEAPLGEEIEAPPGEAVEAHLGEEIEAPSGEAVEAHAGEAGEAIEAYVGDLVCRALLNSALCYVRPRDFRLTCWFLGFCVWTFGF